MNGLDISIVIPMFNEGENVMPLYQALKAVMKEMDQAWEVIFVDDGSTDTTANALKQLHAQDEHVQVIRLRRNFGQTAALAAGLDSARGSIIITMDGDLQNDPADIPFLISKLEEGYDVANGWRVNRQDSLSRRLPSKIANWLISLATGVHLHDYGCTLKAMRREIAKELKLYGEMHRFIPALVANLGGTIVEVPVRHHPRSHGTSKYGLTRTLRVLLDLLTVKFLSGYSTRPGHLFGLFGIVAMLAGSCITLTLGVLRILDRISLSDRPLLLLGILLMIVGGQFITMGLFGELLSRIYHETQEKPIYVIREILRSESRGPSSMRHLSASQVSSLQVIRALREVLREPERL